MESLLGFGNFIDECGDGLVLELEARVAADWQVVDFVLRFRFAFSGRVVAALLRQQLRAIRTCLGTGGFLWLGGRLVEGEELGVKVQVFVLEGGELDSVVAVAEDTAGTDHHV